jgi:nucleoid-associated protein YgaU
VTDRLAKGGRLRRGQLLTSRNGAYTLTLQDDGNVALYTSDKPIWHTDTKGARDIRLILQDDRNLVVYGFDGVAWASGTNTDEPPPPPPPAARTYTVVSGDTLWAISEHFYGDGSKYQRIADASGVSNPDLIHPGQVLTIP